jgi:hypothetical protein
VVAAGDPFALLVAPDVVYGVPWEAFLGEAAGALVPRRVRYRELQTYQEFMRSGDPQDLAARE